MSDLFDDTIVAVATPPGEGGVAIVRLSGPQSLSVLDDVVCRSPQSKDWQPRHLYFGCVLDEEGAIVDEVLAVYMGAPHSYTGQDSAEIHCHGGRLLPQIILDICVRHGARLATPGEYTMRAFLNGKLDLAQSEAVLGLIQAGSTGEVRLNAQGLQGALSQRVREVRGAILDLVARLEAEIDFGEEVDGLSAEEQRDRAQRIRAALEELQRGARVGDALAHGVAVVLIGAPNAGKSTLLNKLAGEERALVTPIPGTTRDQIEARCSLNGVFMRLLDTAGLRQSDDYVERLGMERAREAARRAELVVLVLDGSQAVEPQLQAMGELAFEVPLLVLLNKRDLGQTVRIAELAAELGVSVENVLSVSLLDEDDVPRIGAALARLANGITKGYVAGALSVNQRQLQALVRAQEALDAYDDGVARSMPLDCLLSDLHRALNVLGEITGDSVSEDIVREIFAKFCLGK